MRKYMINESDHVVDPNHFSDFRGNKISSPEGIEGMTGIYGL